MKGGREEERREGTEGGKEGERERESKVKVIAIITLLCMIYIHLYIYGHFGIVPIKL